MADLEPQSLTEPELRLRAHLESQGLRAELIEPGVPTPTVQDAARALGVEAADIVKSVLFETRHAAAAVLVVAPGDRRIDPARVAALSGLERLRVASASRVLNVTGYPAGGVPPVGHPPGLRVIVDASLLRREVLIGGGGSERLLLKIAPEVVVRASGALTGDVCVEPVSSPL